MRESKQVEFKAQGNHEYSKWTGSTIQQLSGNELIRFMLKKQRISWDSLPST